MTEDRCFHCNRPILYSDHLGIFAWRHVSSLAEFCTEKPNSMTRATPDGSEYR